jgi:branched-chain amino acid transport system permease protein
MLTVAISLDFLTSIGFWTGVIVLAGIYTLLALGLQLNVGFTGIINFGQAGFMAIGAYAMAILVLKAGFSFWLALPCSMMISMLFGLLVGLPSLRLRSDYFAIATIASAEVIRLVAQNAQSLTGGSQGLFCSDASDPVYRCFDDSWVGVSDTINGWVESLGWNDPPSLIALLIVVWIAVLLVTVALVLVQKSPWGRVLRAIREDEDAARALGKNTLSYKLQSLIIAAAIGSIAGWFLALDLATIHPTDYLPIVTFFAYSVLVLGGLANYWGVALGGIVFWTLLEGTRFIDLFDQEYKQTALRFFIAGVVLIGIMVFRPQGFVGKREEMVLGD